ncbi:MAG TPA: helix-turn-helix domain-containing protein [Pyrinomonadaceae bacterium]|jgi:excisionase family DNA binding protein
MSEESYLSVTQAARKLKVSRTRVLELINDKRLPAVKIGNSYAIRASDLDNLKLLSVGRPPKQKKI